MPTVQLEPADPVASRGEFDRYHRASPFEHASTANPPPRTIHIGRSVTEAQVHVVHTRVSGVSTKIIVGTTP